MPYGYGSLISGTGYSPVFWIAFAYSSKLSAAVAGDCFGDAERVYGCVDDAARVQAGCLVHRFRLAVIQEDIR